MLVRSATFTAKPGAAPALTELAALIEGAADIVTYETAGPKPAF